MMSLHVLATKTLYKGISANRHANANETIRAEGIEDNVVAEVRQGGGCLHDGLRHIKRKIFTDLVILSLFSAV